MDESELLPRLIYLALRIMFGNTPTVPWRYSCHTVTSIESCQYKNTTKKMYYKNCFYLITPALANCRIKFLSWLFTFSSASCIIKKVRSCYLVAKSCRVKGWKSQCFCNATHSTRLLVSAYSGISSNMKRLGKTLDRIKPRDHSQRRIWGTYIHNNQSIYNNHWLTESVLFSKKQEYPYNRI